MAGFLLILFLSASWALEDAGEKPAPVISDLQNEAQPQRGLNEEAQQPAGTVEAQLEDFNEDRDSKERGLSSLKKIKRTRIKRDKSFKVPKTKAKAPKKRRIRLRDIQPPSRTRLYYDSGSDEAELEKVINSEIKQLFRLLKKDRNADLTLRLGSLYVEKSRLISFKIQADYEKKLRDYNEGRRRSKPYLNLKPAQAYNQKSLKLFEDFKTGFPNHKRMDEVLFFLGFNFYQLENIKLGMKYFSDLEKRFPKSPYLYESRFKLGEHYFKLGDWKNSFKYYSKVIRNKRGKFYFFALYKMAWSSYKMGRASQGLGLLRKIILESRAFKVISDRDQIFTFNKEAVDDLVLFYTYSKRSPLRAKSFFLNLVGDERAWSSLKRMAYLYRDTGQARGAMVLFEDLIQRDPLAKEAFEYKYQIVETVYNFGKISDIIRQTNEWVKNYGPGSPWLQANRGIEHSLKLQEETVKNYALKNHKSFQSAKSGRAKALALHFYKIFFEHFNHSKFLDQMRYHYAELLFDSGKYMSAARSYEEVISRFPTSKYAKAAFINQLLALEKVLPSDRHIQKLVGKGNEPVEFPNSVQSFIKAAGRYVEKYPRAKNSPSILYRMAALHYKFNQMSGAAALFKKMSDKYPTSKLASNVGGILLEIYSKNKDYKSLELLAIKLAGNKHVKKDLLREARSILEQISFKKAQDLALNKKYGESAALYEKFAKAHSTSPLAPSAFYNAGLNFEKSGNRLKAASMYSAVLSYKGRRNVKIQKKSQEFLAILYEKLGFYRKAARAYISFAKKHPSDPKSSDFWYNAGVIFDALNDTASAIYAYKRHSALSGKRDRHEVHYLIGLMNKRSRRWQKAIESYSQYLKSPSSNKIRLMKASFDVADIYENRLRNPQQAKVWHQKTLNLYKRLRAGVSYGARSHFYLTREFYTRFSKVQIPAASKKQAVAVEKKIKLLKELEQALKPIIRYDDGEQIIASLALIGQANQEMAQAIYKAPIPKGLGKKGQAQYRDGIKKVIDPYIKQAIKHYQLALKKSSELKIYSEDIEKAYKGLFSIQLSKGHFDRFLPPAPLQEILPFQVLDNTGAVTEGLFSALKKSLRYGVSLSDFESLSQAIESRREGAVLKAVSAILNKDPNNIVAINSLALYYLLSNRWGLGALILNRVSSKKSNDPIIMNNLAMVSLNYGDVREAVAYLKKALSANRSYAIARVNLANILIQQYDYKSAYAYYKGSYRSALKKWPSTDKKAAALLNNYGSALTGVSEWSAGLSVFKKITEAPSPLPEILFNYAVFLAEKSKGEDKEPARETLLRAKELAGELLYSSGSARLKRKARQLARSVNERLKRLKEAGLK